MTSVSFNGSNQAKLKEMTWTGLEPALLRSEVCCLIH